MADDVVITVRADDQFSSVLGNFGNIMTGIKSTIDLVSSAIQTGAEFIGQFVDSASESEQAVARLDGVLRATGGAAGLTSDELQGMADSLQEVTRFSDETILAGEAILLTFRNISGETFERTVPAMLDMAEIFGSVDSAAMQLGKALNDPITGMGALSRAGITFSEDQKKAIEAFVKTNDLASAQNIILSEVEAQVSGLATTMGGTFVGQVEIFKNQLDSIKETIGGAFIPILKDLLAGFMEFLDRPEIISFFEGLANNIAAFPTDPIFAITDSLYQLGYTLEQLGLSGANDFFSNLGDAILNGNVVQVLGEAFTSFTASIDWDKISNDISDGIASIDWGKVGNTISTALGYIAIGIGNILANIDWSVLLNSFANAFADIVGGLFGFVDWEDMINSAGVGFRYVGQSIVDGIKFGIQSTWNSLSTYFMTNWNDFVRLVKNFLGISSPSSVFMNIAKDIIGGLIAGFTLYWGDLINLATSSLDNFLNLFGIDLSFGGTSASGLGMAGGGVSSVGSSSGGTSGEVHNYYYGPVYFMGGSEPGSYECMPNPILTAGSGILVTSPR